MTVTLAVPIREDIDEVIDRVTSALLTLTDETGEHLETMADGRIIDSISWNFWEWPQAIGLNGLFTYYYLKQTQDPGCPRAAKALGILKDWFEARSSEAPTKKNINSMSVLFSIASLLDLDSKLEAGQKPLFTPAERKRYSAWLVEWAEWAMNELPRTEQGGFQHITHQAENRDQLWDDTLMMTVLPLAKIGVMLGKQVYIDEAKYQFLMHIQYLTDNATGLWYHAWIFEDGGHNFAKALWGRGNCWVTMAIPMLIEILNLAPTDPVYRICVSSLRRQAEALVRYQDSKTGRWHTLINESETYLETSCSAGFTAGLLMGVRLGLLDREKYFETAAKGLKGCIQMIGSDGRVGGVSKGTAVGEDLEFYRRVAIVPYPYGQSLVIVALAEWLQS